MYWPFSERPLAAQVGGRGNKILNTLRKINNDESFLYLTLACWTSRPRGRHQFLFEVKIYIHQFMHNRFIKNDTRYLVGKEEKG